MALYNSHFYHSTYRNCLLAFGSLFENIEIRRYNANGTENSRSRVPLTHGPKERYIYGNEEDADFRAPLSTTLPRMSYEAHGLRYAPERMFSPTQKLQDITITDHGKKVIHQPVPYDIDVSLYIMTGTLVEGHQIIEQIMPFFGPEISLTVKLLDVPEQDIDVPVILKSIVQEDVWDSNFTERRRLIWTMDFTLKAYFYGPVKNAKRIEIVDLSTYELSSFDPFATA